MSNIRTGKCIFNFTDDPRILTIECTDFSAREAAVNLLRIIDTKVLRKDVFILNIKGSSVLTLTKVFKDLCIQSGFKNKEILSKIFRIQAEEGVIVLNKKIRGKVFMVGKPIPG